MSSGPWKERPHDREAILRALEAYIDEEEVPIVAEFCSRNKIKRTTLLSWPESADLVEMSKLKKEAALESGALSGQLNTTAAIFSLKQLGWTDRQEQTLQGPGGTGLTIQVLRLGQKPAEES